MSEYLWILIGVAVFTGCLHTVVAIGAKRPVFGNWRTACQFFFGLYLVGFIWDKIAVERGHWAFNPDMVTGWWAGLPVEEHLFFIVVPYLAVVSLAFLKAIRRDA